MTIAERIILVVEQVCGGNMSDFARSLNVTPAYISKLKRLPDTIPSDRTILDICERWNVSREWLQTGEGEMFCPITKQQEIMDFINGLLLDDGSDEMRQFKIDLIATLAQMSPEQWRTAADFFRMMNANGNKNDEEG